MKYTGMPFAVWQVFCASFEKNLKMSIPVQSNLPSFFGEKVSGEDHFYSNTPNYPHILRKSYLIPRPRRCVAICSLHHLTRVV